VTGLNQVFTARGVSEPPGSWEAKVSEADGVLIPAGHFLMGCEAGQEEERRAWRGGSWRHQVKVRRGAARSSLPPVLQYADYGFRLVRDVR
jgi:formylglycine-generating enzyme required for sulfatase activity